VILKVVESNALGLWSALEIHSIKLKRIQIEVLIGKTRKTGSKTCDLGDRREVPSGEVLKLLIRDV
jgi:hypothetical protein